MRQILVVLGVVVHLGLEVNAQEKGCMTTKPEPGDLNGDRKFDISDIIYGLGRLYLGGPPLCPFEAEPPACPSIPSLDLPATGQSVCFDSSGTEIDCDLACDCPGQNGAYQSGCPRQGRFEDNGDGTITDRCTGLMWQKDTVELSWCEALASAENAVTGGYDDWRIPNVTELYSLIDFGAGPPNLDPAFNGSGNFWTSTSADGESAWRIAFGNGRVDFESKQVRNHVRAVRQVTEQACGRSRAGSNPLPATGQTQCFDAQGAPVSCATNGGCAGQDGAYQAGCPQQGRFVDNGDGTVSDFCTGLMWQKGTVELPWCTALANCESASTANHTDWRLPNVRELFSLIDLASVPHTLNPIFNGSGNFWSSTSADGVSAWRVSFGQGSVIAEGKSIKNHVRAVRSLRR